MHLLIEHLDDYLDAFERHQPFRADQVQAHRAALERRARYHSAEELLDDPEFFRLVIDVLRSWQMDVRGARLSSLADIHAAFRAHAETLTRLWPLSLDQLRISDLQPVHADLWRLISEIRVSATASNIVAASKAVHHVLPDLLPPIDRRYTLAFLGYGSAFSVSKERDAFDRAFPIFHQIAWRRPDVIRRRLGLGMHTTVGKVIDNAIVGFVVTEMRG